MTSIALFAAALLSVTAPALSAPLSATAQARLGQPIRLANLAVRPLRVIEDSRCPRMVTCAWRGRLRLEVAVNGRVMTIDDGKAVAAGGGSLTLVNATPLSQRGERVPLGAYRFTLNFKR